MSDRKTAIIGLKRTIRGGARDGRDLRERNARWRKVCSMLRGLAGLDDAQFRNLLKAEYFLLSSR